MAAFKGDGSEIFERIYPKESGPEFKVVGNKLVRIEGGEATPVDGINGEGAPLVNLNIGDQASAPAFEDNSAQFAFGAFDQLGALFSGAVDSVTGLDLNPQQREARTKIDNANTQFMLVGSASLPGRPSNLTREQINSMTPKPGVMGEAQAKSKARETAAYLEREIQAVQSLLNSGNPSAGDRSQLA